MNNICKICNEIVTERKHFYSKHKTKEADYYQLHFPRHDLFTNEVIPFKSPESYFLTDFITRTNLSKYLKKLDKEKGLDYCQEWLKRRKEAKNLTYAPSEFEAKSLIFPSIKFFHEFYDNLAYESICLDVGLEIRYSYNEELEFYSKELEIICDTREQELLDFKNKQIKKLNFGDYTVEDNKGIFVERKSLSDFLGTMSKGYERFTKELERCKKDNGYLIIIIEEQYGHLSSYPYLPHTKRVKAKPDYIQHQIRELMHKFPIHCQFLAVDGRKESIRVIEKIFNYKEDIKLIDLQYYYNNGKL